MKPLKEFPFERARRVISQEVQAAHQAIEEKLGRKRPFRGRPPKEASERYRAISIRLHPQVLKWAKQEARKKGVGYQSVLNQVLLKIAA